MRSNNEKSAFDFYLLSGLSGVDNRFQRLECRLKIGTKLENRRIMDNEILMVLEDNGYRVLHGHLHLSTLIGECDEIVLHVPGKGNVTVRRTAGGLMVHDGEVSLPILKR